MHSNQGMLLMRKELIVSRFYKEPLFHPTLFVPFRE